MNKQRGDAEDILFIILIVFLVLLFIGEPDLWDKMNALLDHELNERGVELPEPEKEDE